MQPIKAIIFDLGGPIVEWASGMVEICREHEVAYGLAPDTLRVFLRGFLTRGGVGEFKTIQEYIEATKPELGLTTEQLAAVFDQANATMYARPDMVRYITELKKSYKIGLLSNFTADLEHYLKDIFHIAHLFDSVVSSYDVRIRKPDPRIYEYSLVELGVRAEEAVFIDDYEENTRAAEALGMITVVFKDSLQCQRDLDIILNQ